MNRYASLFLSALALLLAACATSEPARQLAERSAANTSLLSREIVKLAAHEARIAELRARTLADYAEAIARSRADYELDVALTAKSGDSAALALKKDLDQWISQAAFLAKLPSGHRDAIVADIQSTQKPLTPKIEELNKVATALAELAKKEDFATRAAFLAGYVGEVAELVKASEAETEEAAHVAVKAREGVKAAAPKATP